MQTNNGAEPLLLVCRQCITPRSNIIERIEIQGDDVLKLRDHFWIQMNHVSL